MLKKYENLTEEDTMEGQDKSFIFDLLKGTPQELNISL